MRPVAKPTFRSLTKEESTELLRRNHVGRLAFTFHDRVDVQPVNYVYDAGWLFGRTSDGAKLMTLAHNQWLAFEVDEVRGPFDWASVVARGAFRRIDPDGPPRERAAAARAVRLLRAIVPETYTADDPAGFRTVLFRILIDEMTGRAAHPAAPADVAAAGQRARRARVPVRRITAPPNPNGW